MMKTSLITILLTFSSISARGQDTSDLVVADCKRISEYGPFESLEIRHEKSGDYVFRRVLVTWSAQYEGLDQSAKANQSDFRMPTKSKKYNENFIRDFTWLPEFDRASVSIQVDRDIAEIDLQIQGDDDQYGVMAYLVTDGSRQVGFYSCSR